jgi:PTH2 family peptidyl-tRNA hydrolase
LSTDEFRYKQVIAVRTDLDMGKGKVAVQVAHASVSALEEARKRHREWVEAWLAEGQCKIAVKAESEEDLVWLKEKARELDIPAAIVHDRGLTQLPPDTATCVGIGPGPAAVIDKMTRDLKLL